MQDLFDDHVDLDCDAELAEATRAIPAGAGVCLFAGENDQPIILLRGAGLRSIVRNRLTEPDPTEKSRRLHLRPITKRLYFRQAYSAFETELAYFHLVQELYPDKFQEFFPNLTAWFIKLDLSSDYPVFSRTNKAASPNSLSWGPFGTKKAADHCIDLLQDMFQLCRCHQNLANAPHAQACSYAQMGRCLAVCDGTISKQQYRQQIDTAIDFMNHDCSQNIAILQQRMKTLAADRQYEQAQKVKEQIEQVKKLNTYAYRWVAPVERFYVYAFQPGPPIKVPGKRAYQRSITPFVIGPGWVSQVEPFVAEDTLKSCQALIDHYQLSTLQESQEHLNKQADLLAWATRFLYGSSAAKGFYVRADEASSAQQLLEQLTKHFNHIQKTEPAPEFPPTQQSSDHA